jgi:type IX secretion system PorP/SprF family membrane protein
MMMKKYAMIFSLLGLVSVAKAQQVQTSSLADMQGFFVNPAMAGVDQKMMIGATYRTQWAGTSGAPKTATLFGSIDIPSKKIGLGGYVFSDKTGATSRTGLQLAFAKHLPLSNDAQLSLGIEGTAMQYSIDVAKLSQTLGTDPVLNSGGNKFKADAGFGIVYSGKKLEIGASVSQLLQTKLNYYSGTGTTNEEGKLYRHYFLHGTYKWRVDEETVITPNFLMVYLPNAPVDLQAGFRFEHHETFWWGLGARMHQGVMVSAGVHINKKFTIGYVFELFKTPYSVYEKGANGHELLLRYSLPKSQN